MRRITIAKTIAASAAIAAATTAGAAATGHSPVADDSGDSTSTVVNKNGHEVDEHAAKGQARAAEARAQHSDDDSDEPEDEDETVAAGRRR